MKDKQDCFSVLIPDGEKHTLLYVINCLGGLKNVKIYVMSNGRRNPMRFSRNIHKFLFYPKTNSNEAWIHTINDVVEKYNIDVIMPVFEVANEILIKHKKELKYEERLSILPTLENFKTANNKGALYQHLLENELACPKSLLIKAGESKEKALSDFKFPVIVKPTEGFGGGLGILKFEHFKDCVNYLNTIKGRIDYLIQEYISGYDMGCSVLCKDGEVLVYTIQKGTLKNKPFEPLLGLVFIDNEDQVLTLAKKLMKSLNWSGVAHIDFIYDKKEERFKILEINPRFWSSLDASFLAGVNFPYLYCLLSLNKDFTQPNYNPIAYLNLKGLIKSLKERNFKVLKRAFLLKNTAFVFALKDPVPMLFKFIYRTNNIIVRRLRKI